MANIWIFGSETQGNRLRAQLQDYRIDINPELIEETEVSLIIADMQHTKLREIKAVLRRLREVNVVILNSQQHHYLELLSCAQTLVVLNDCSAMKSTIKKLLAA